MKPEDKAQELIDMIKAQTYCSDDEASRLAVSFINMLIEHTKKLEYFRPGPQEDYWKKVLDHIYI
jgi:hypothetical protein